jgi:hypothetical protein
MRLERGRLGLERVADVDPRVGGHRAADQDFLHLVRRETFGEQVGEDAARFRGRKHGVEGGAGDGAMVRVVQVLVAVVTHRGITAHDDVRANPPDHAREIATQPERGLHDAVGIAEQHDVLHAEDARRLVQLTLSRGDEPVAIRRVLVGPRPAGGDETEQDAPPFPRPARDAPGHRELDVVGMRRDAEDRPKVFVEVVRAFRSRHGLAV